MPVRDRGHHLGEDKPGRGLDVLLVSGRAEPAALAGKGHLHWSTRQHKEDVCHLTAQVQKDENRHAAPISPATTHPGADSRGHAHRLPAQLRPLHRRAGGVSPTGNIQQPTANNIQHPTSNIQQPTANSQQPTANNIQQPTAYSLHPTSNSQQPMRRIEKPPKATWGESRK